LTHYNLANALRIQGKIGGAIQHYRQALELRGDFAQAHNNLGLALMAIAQLDEAKTQYRKALDLQPEFADAANNLSCVLLDEHDYDAAIEWLERALKHSQHASVLYGNLAYALVMNRSWDKAKETIDAGFKASAQSVLLNVAYAQFLSEKKEYKQATDLLSKLDVSTAIDKERKLYHYELGKLYDRLGDPEGAHRHLLEANRLAQNEAGQNGILKDPYLQQVETISNAPLTVTTQKTPNDQATPVFLVGFPRSGTTLLDQIIDTHPGFATLEEKPFINNIAKAVSTLPGGYPNALADLSNAQLDDLRADYWTAVHGELELQKSTTLVDKLPLSIIHVGLIHRLFPNAKFILAIRHPCDACHSSFMQNFLINSAMANFFTLEETTHLYVKVMDLWHKYSQGLSIDFHMVRYEDLVKDLEGEARKLFTFLDQPWDDAVLAYYEHARKRKTISTPSRAQVDKPIYTDAVYRWKRYGSVMKGPAKTLKPYIDLFGYE
ncbi:MAG: sulfotransferase, partial [Magnetovibrio sp.]|nr:sulfotransferase [Magnetovibrio sp.]